mmetsp:Transcript_49822/g.153860  ORF Transcript_49822/g.153860 Transcript_49822/m.153860 type:complete len:1584 (+) Transcript_49822:1327-6078(+)
MEVDRVEWKLPGEADRHHNHPGNPEEQYVMTCLKQRGREEGVEVVVALGVGPAEDGEGEEAGGEPGVQDVLVLDDLHALDAQLRLRLRHGLLHGLGDDPDLLVDGLLRLGHAVGRDAVPPPQLSGDAPVLDVLQPVVPRLVVELRKDLQVALAQRLHALVRQVLAVHPPLGLQVWLNDVLGPRADTEAHGVGLLADPQAFLLQCLLDRLPRLEAVLLREGAAVLVDVSGLREDVDLLQAEALAAPKIVTVVGGGDLHASCPEGLVDHGVGHHHHLALREEGVLDLLSVEGLVAVVVGVHGDRRVSEHRLQSGRGNDQEVLRALDLVLELAEDTHLDLVVEAGDAQVRLAGDILVVHLEVRERRAQVRAPVHQAVVAVDEALVVEADEGLLHGAAEHLVHGEALPRPVHAGGDLAQLRADAAAVLLLPGPDALEELLTAQVVPGKLLLLEEEPLHHALGGDASVVGAGNPEGHVTAHPVPAGKRVLDGAGERVAEVQGARDVRRRDDHDESLGLLRLLGLGGVRSEEPPLLPPEIPGGLHGGRVVPIGHLQAHVLLLAGRGLDHGPGDLVVRLGLGLGLLAGEPGSGKASKEAKAKAKADNKVARPVVETPPGEKKDMSLEMADGYDPTAVESAWNLWWEKRGFFTPDAAKSKQTKESKRFIMVIPPPNVTGSLHLGHTLTCAIEDSLSRWHRMCGDVTLWVPGTDHAGIATQSVVERLLLKQEKLTRHDLGREKFLERVWAWKEKNGSRICTQLRKIAASVDWSRERFTMDQMLGRAVQEAFIRFHDQGLIYRDNRLVNWCPHLRTALSDLEVDHEDIPGKTYLSIPGFDDKVEVGVLCEFKYKIKGSEDFLVVATTRLETMLGDTAVAVHPDDDRYKAFHGKEVEHPFFPERKMVVVADPMVDKAFGTGCVKITPAHDRNDFGCGQRFGLEQINVFAESGDINENGGPFAKQHRFKARKTVEEALKEKGLWVGKKSHAMRLGICSRSKDIIEPYLKPQWWMNCKDLADKSVKALRQGDLKILPEFHHQTWYHWLENIQDWCISRQLWWGHRIPAYRVTKPEQPIDKEVWIIAKSVEEAVAKAEAKLGVKGVEVIQDEDVLDTWFSSGLFPFSVFGWPDTEGNDDFDAFFPTSLLETGHDILFFWVARMVMMSIGLTGKLPFHTIYLHAMVRDAHGRKMSKSLGNVIDPIEVIEGIALEDLQKKLYEGNLPDKEIEKAKKGQEADFPEGIPQCGADALRFGLLAYTLQGRHVNLDISRVVGYRHFCNKVWNATRFGLRYFGEGFRFPGSLTVGMDLTWEDRWILSRLSACAEKSNKAFEKYEFANATTATYSFFLYDLCAVYLELLKPRFHAEGEGAKADQQVAKEVLYVCLDWSFRLMHPLLPYLTEELYQRLPPSPVKSESICVAPYPTHVIAWTNEQVEKEMEVVSEIAARFRSQKKSLGLAESARPKGFLRHNEKALLGKLTKLTSRLSCMAGYAEVTVLEEGASSPSGTLRDVVNDKCVIFTEVSGLDLTAELAKLQKKVTSAEKMAASYEAKMAMAGYEEKVPAEVREMNAQKLKEKQLETEELKRAVASIEEAMRG